MRFTPMQAVRYWVDTPRRILFGIALREGVDDPIEWLQNNAPAKVFDRRAKPGERFGKRAVPRGARTWDEIEGETFHQTAVGPHVMSPRAIRKCPVHCEIDHLGNIWLLWDPRVVLWQANYLNDESIGIEIDCRAAGVEGDDSTVWISRKERAEFKTAPDVLREATDTQLEAGRIAGIYYALLLRANWSDPDRTVKVWAHRQGHRSRTTDPGSRIYKNVCAKLIERDEFVAGAEQGSGKTIPEEWRG